MAAVASLGSVYAQAPVSPGPADDRGLPAEWIDQLFASRMAAHDVSGGACAFVRVGQEPVLRGYGVADREAGTAVDPERTLFYLASVTKAFTGMTAAILAEKGLVDIDEDVDRYLPAGVRVGASGRGPITLRHLLTHTGGFDDKNIGIASPWDRPPPPLSEYLAESMPPLVRDPGVVASYDNHGFALAGLVLEAVTGLSFDACVRERLLDPAGMNRTFASMPVPAPFETDAARGYVTRYPHGVAEWRPTDRYRRKTPRPGSSPPRPETWLASSSWCWRGGRSAASTSTVGAPMR